MNRGGGSENQISADPTSLALTESSPPKIMSSGKSSSRSLPSSPRFVDSSFFRKHKAKTKVTPCALARQHSVALSNLEHLRESRMSRSKSCGEGRACPPTLDFDLRSTNNHQTKEDTQYHHHHQTQQEQTREGEGERESDKFKCGACLFLPGFGKGKAVRPRKEVDSDNIVTHRVSLEKFECGSWRSPAIINYGKDGDDDTATITTSNLFFDLPMELMRFSGVNDTESPVTAGFVFDNEDHHHHNRKGVLKSATSMGRKSELESFNSSRRVRFSSSSLTLCPSSPTSPCITPRLRMARDDFNTFLEAQSG